MKKSVEILKQFLETKYIHNEEMDSSDIMTAVRDLLTDVAYICAEEEVEIGQKVSDALSVYYTEIGCYRSSDSLNYLNPNEPESHDLVALINYDGSIELESGVAIVGVGIYDENGVSYDAGIAEDGTIHACIVNDDGIVMLDGGLTVSEYHIDKKYPELLRLTF